MLDTALLIALVIQGFAVWFYEHARHVRETNREAERLQWREDKRKAALRRIENGQAKPALDS